MRGQVRSVRSVLRTLDILDVLAGGARSVGAIARELRLPKTTVYRLLMTLEQREMVSRGDAAEEFRLGRHLLHLGLRVRASSDLYEAALPHMQELRERFGETVRLNVRVANERLCVAALEGLHSLRLTGGVGERSPLHSGAAARAMLAFLHDERIEDYVAANRLTQVTEDTITDPARLWAAIREARRVGYAVSVGERTKGITSVGVPIYDGVGGVAASINVSGPTERMSTYALDEVGDACRAAGSAISAALGFVSLTRQAEFTGARTGNARTVGASS